MLYRIETSIILPIEFDPNTAFCGCLSTDRLSQLLWRPVPTSTIQFMEFKTITLCYIEDGRVMQQMAPIYKLFHTQECIYFGPKKTGTLTAIWSTSSVVLLIETPVSWAGFLYLIWQSMNIKVMFAKTTQLMISSLITVSDKEMKNQNQVPRVSINLLLGRTEFSEALHSFGTMLSWNQVLVLKNTPRAL